MVAPPTGLVRTFYSDVGFAGEPLFQDRTTEVSLAFLDEDPTLPRRLFSVEWRGFWYLSHAQTVNLYAGADDRVDVLVDGRLVLRRNPVVGMHTAGETIRLNAGVHEIIVRYEQDRGGTGLNIQAISEFPKGRKYLISLSFRGKSSVRPVQVGGSDVNIVPTAVRGRSGPVRHHAWLPALGAILSPTDGPRGS